MTEGKPPQWPMFVGMAAAAAVMMFVSRPLKRTIGQYPGMTMSVLLSCAVYVLATRLLYPKPPA